MAVMAKKNTKARTPDDDKDDDDPAQVKISLWLHAALLEQLRKLKSRNASKLSTEVQIAIRERLEKFSLWPPPTKGE